MGNVARDEGGVIVQVEEEDFLTWHCGRLKGGGGEGERVEEEWCLEDLKRGVESRGAQA